PVAETGGADLNQAGIVRGHMIETADPGIDLFADDQPPFLIRLEAVNSQREHNEDVAVGNAGRIERVDDWRQHQVGAGQSSDVVHHDGDAFTRTYDFAQGRAPDGRFKGLVNRAGLV